MYFSISAAPSAVQSYTPRCRSMNLWSIIYQYFRHKHRMPWKILDSRRLINEVDPSIITESNNIAWKPDELLSKFFCQIYMPYFIIVVGINSVCPLSHHDIIMIEDSKCHNWHPREFWKTSPYSFPFVVVIRTNNTNGQFTYISLIDYPAKIAGDESRSLAITSIH